MLKEKKYFESRITQTIRQFKVYSTDVGNMLLELLTKISESRTKEDLQRNVFEFQDMYITAFTGNPNISKATMNMMKNDLQEYSDFLNGQLG